MAMNMNEKYLKESHLILNRLIDRSKKFCMTITPDALSHIFMMYRMTGKITEETIKNIRISYDYDYFALTKSIKSLIAAKKLLKDSEYNFNEDCLMLVRSIFENHILSRYVREHIDSENEKNQIIEKFVINPLSVSFDFYSQQGNVILDENGTNVGKILTPSKHKMGLEVVYYSEFYQYLCQHTHCSFGALSCYFDENEFFTFSKSKHALLTMLMLIFVYTKIYEGVITVDGEDLGKTINEKKYYDLAYDSLELQLKLFNYLIEYYSNTEEDNTSIIIKKYLGTDINDNENLKIARMLQKMKESIFDHEIGSLNKKEISTSGQFERYYPKHK